MESRDLFRNLSPIDHRYYLANREAYERLSDYLSEEALVRYCVRAEAALVLVHSRRHGIADAQTQVMVAVERLDPSDVYEEEAKTHHNVRAIVRVFQRLLPAPLRPFVHLGATSMDILDTANAARYRDAVAVVLVPELIDLGERLVRLAEEHAETPQVGRTHGQHAVPITFGFAVASYVSRLSSTIPRILDAAQNLRGKLSGAVGAYNATSLLFDDPFEAERAYLAMLGLSAADHATQIVQPEFLLRLVVEVNSAFGIIANLADDLRNLQRSEIGEVTEGFASGQVGSSTMPQKRNPWNSEHVKSLWKAMVPRVMTMFMDQISEHQRDLTNSASARFLTEYFAGFLGAVRRISSVLDGLAVHCDRMAQNLAGSTGATQAEALYILLAADGEEDGHEVIRQLTLRSEQTGRPLAEVLETMPEVFARVDRRSMERLGCTVATLLKEPGRYTGAAAARTRAVCRRAVEVMEDAKRSLQAIAPSQSLKVTAHESGKGELG